MKTILSRLCPYAEEAVIRRLRERRAWRKLANYLWVEFLMARGSSRLWGGRPYWLTLDPTNFCQLHCPFCPTGANKGIRDKSSMSLEHFKKLMDQIGPAVIHMDMMNWGESVLNLDLPEMIAYARRFGIEIRLDTNFNDVSEKTIEKLILSGLDIIGISIDGLTQETYAKYRIGGSLEKALKNLSILVRKRVELGRRNPHIIWQFLVFRHNEHEVEQVESFARSRGVDKVCIKRAYMSNEPGYLWEWLPRNPQYRFYSLPSRPASPEEADRAQRNAHMKNTSSRAAYHARRFPGPLHRAAWSFLKGTLCVVDSPSDIIWAGRLALNAAMETWRGRKGTASPLRNATDRGGAQKPSICKWPWAGMTINPEGSVSPCCSIENQADDFGNVFSQSWQSLWEGKNYKLSRRHVSRYTAGKEGVLRGSENACLRCNIIGKANFEFSEPV